jgi:hypothetical protein
MCRSSLVPSCCTRGAATPSSRERGASRVRDMPLVAIFVFEGPDLLCERVYWDRLTLFIQLGVARDPNTPAGKLTTLLNHPVTLTRATIRNRRNHL